MRQNFIGQHYVLQDELGSGGMGTVYKGLDTRSEQSVAIKQLHARLADDRLIERFKREGEALRELNHPNIVKMLDAVEEDGKHFLIMEYVSGSDLAGMIKRGGLALDRVLNIAIDLADALTRAHRLNIIHRDLKPENILIGSDGVLRLTDFGLAYLGSRERVTETDTIVGTIDYLPPDVFAGMQFDERGDIWAFGVILYEMLTGEHPFRGDTMAQIVHSIISDSIPNIENKRKDIPIALVDLVYRMLERSLDARIQSVRQIGMELEDILKGRTTLQTTVSARFDVGESDIFAVKKHNLPIQSTPFVGREPEIDELKRLITAPEIRLVTIIAPGGMGKTRLALEVAYQHLDHFEDGVYFVELAPLTLAEQIVPAIGAALDYKFQQGEGAAKQELMEFLLNKQILLVMDNFEHLLDGAGLVGEILSHTNSVQILATSRQRLAQMAENILHLSGMDFPTWETPEDALQFAAIKLFVNSARRVKPDFELTEDNLDYVARVCKLVQGMPLAIVLSGAWVEMLSPQEISSELERSIDILSDEVGELPARQRSIRSVMDYAWRMMESAEQAVFFKLSVFMGGFTREAAQTVTNANLRTLMSLVTKSLIRRNADSGRYEIHELLRQYAHEKLIASGSMDAVCEQHASYFSAFLAQQLPQLKGNGQMKSLADIDRDYENCVAAWLWSVEHDKLELIDSMIDSLYLYYQFHYLFDAGHNLFQLARQQWPLGSGESPSIAGRLSARFIGTEERDVVLPILDKCLTLAEKQGHLAEIAFCQRELGRLNGHHSGDRDLIVKGIDHLQTSLTLCRQLGDRYLEALILDDIGYAYFRIGDVDTRLEYSGQSVALRREIGDLMGYGDCLVGYATMLYTRDIAKSLEISEQARDLAYQTKSSYLLNMITPSIGTIYMFMGKFEKAYEAFETGYRLSLATKNERWRLSGQFGMAAALCMMDRDMDLVRQYLRNAAPEGSLIYRDTTIAYYRRDALAHYSAKVGDDAVLFAQLQYHVSFSKYIGPLLPVVIYYPLYAYWLGRNRNPERAIEWLSFSHTYQTGTIDSLYMNTWSVIVDFRESLRKEMGDEKFDALWESGKLLDTQTVFEQIIEEFVSDS